MCPIPCKPLRWLVLAAAISAWAAVPLDSQESPQPTQQASPKTSPAPSTSQKRGQAQASPPDDHRYDAFNAEKDIEVGTFYMHKGDVDAAIPRFEDAAKLRPEYGKPRLLLAEAYEKKHDASTSLKYYKEYLRVYPHAPDAKKIEKKIEKLEGR